VGSETKSFMLDGHRIAARNGVCVARDGTLAGSDLDMASAVRNAVRLLGQDPAQAANMASRNPATFLGLSGSIGAIAPGKQADLVLMTDDLRVVQTWIAGRTPDV